jgi:hypothetical protein
MTAFSTLSRLTRIGAFGIACSVIVACAQGNAETNSEPMAMHHAMTAASSKAADLRSALDELLSEHVILAAEATNAALAGRQPDFQAAAAALFLPLWRSHINLVVDYTVGTASNDPAKAQQAVNKLLAYSGDLAGFFSGANPNLSKEAVADMVKEHIVTLKAVIDAQAKKDYAAEYTAQRTAYHHMGMMALALADGIAKQFPQKFS